MGIKYEETCQQNQKLCSDRRIPCYLTASSETQITEEASRASGMSGEQAERFRQRCMSACPRSQTNR